MGSCTSSPCCRDSTSSPGLDVVEPGFKNKCQEEELDDVAFKPVIKEVQSKEVVDQLGLNAVSDLLPQKDGADRACQYLPFEIRGVPVLERKADGYLVDNSMLKSQLAGLTCRNSKRDEDRGELIINFGSTIDGIVEEAGDGMKWLKFTIEAQDTSLPSTSAHDTSFLPTSDTPTESAPVVPVAFDFKAPTKNTPVVGEETAVPSNRLEDRLKAVRDACRGLRVLDAGRDLQQLEHEVAVQSTIGESRSLADALSTDRTLTKLRNTHRRMQDALQQIAIPSLRQDVQWSELEIKDPSMFPDYCMDLKIRHAEESEYEEGGSSSQIIGIASVTNMPLTLAKRLALDRETDLFQKSWVKDCEEMSGQQSGPESLHSVYFRVQVAPRLLPGFRFEDLMMREFSICKDPPLPGLPPGLMKVESCPPEGILDWEGFEIPGVKKGVTRMGNTKIFYFKPSEKPGCCNATIMVRCNLPIPKWLLPLSICKRILGIQMSNAIKSIKDFVIPEWEQRGYDARIKASPEFYGTIKEFEDSLKASTL